ncbi:MAG: hypothetical protein NZ528_01440, partial [Caldilineales bacterium]|nr:hypothetical protein [Caldilineales bacterium]
MSGFRRFFWLLWLLALAALALAACAPAATPTATPTPAPSPTPTLAPTPTPTATPAPPPALTADRLAAALPGLQALGPLAVRCPGGDDPALAALCLAAAHGAAPS